MPAIKRKKRAFSRSRSKARKRLYTANVPRNIGQGPITSRQFGVLGNRRKATLRCAITIEATAEVKPYYIYMMGNGLVDPFFAFGNVSPAGYDELIALYQSWYVRSSSIKVLGRNTNTSGQVTYCFPTTELLHRTAIPSGLVQPGSVVSLNGPSGSGNDIYEMSNFSTTSAQFGKTNAQCQGEDDFIGTAIANPTADSSWYWYLQFFDEDNTNAVSTTFTVVMTYYCEFFNPQQLGQS